MPGLRCLLLVGTLVLTGCSRLFSAPPPQLEPAPETIKVEYHEHTVQLSGETLGLIAAWYTGTPSHWKEIQSHNPGLDVHRIKINDTIKIPESLLITTEGLTASALRRLQQAMRSSTLKRVQTETADVIPIRSKSSVKLRNTTYHFKVEKVSGCENLGNTFNGLVDCAELISAQLDK